MRGVVLLLAAGVGSRLGSSDPKAFLELDGKSLLRRSAEAAAGAELVDSLVIAVPAGCGRRAGDELVDLGPLLVIDGSDTRQGSAAAALDAVPSSCEAILVHDAARPLAPSSLFDACLRALDTDEAVCPALPLADTIKDMSGDHVTATLDRSYLVAAQTPQGFRTELYKRAHEAAARDGFVGTDDASLVERLGVDVRIIAGDDRNMKVTTKHDAQVAEALLRVPR